MSKSEKHIKEAMQSSFDKLQRKAPKDLWQQLSTGLNLSNDESLIKESFTEISKKAPISSWGEIKRGVIIDEVWDKIVLQEKRKKRLIFWWTFSASIALLLIITPILLNNDISSTDIQGSGNQHKEKKEYTSVLQHRTESSSTNNSNNNQQAYLETILVSDPINTDIFKDRDNSQIGDSDSSYSNLDKQLVKVQNHDYPPETLIDTSSVDNQLKKDRELINLLALPIINPLLNDIAFNSPDFELKKPQKQNYRKFELGLQTGLNNSWILNNDVKSGFKSESLIKNKFSLGYNAGFVFNFNINRKNTISVQYDILSVLNENYNIFSHGQLQEIKINLNRQKIGLLYKRNFVFNTSQKNYFVLKSGIFLSHSNKTTISYSSDVFESDFESYDFGLKLAFGYEHDFNRIKLEYGLQSDAGLLNISSGNEYLPKKLNHTNTFITGVYTSIRYNF